MVIKALKSRRRVLVVRKVARTNENSTFKVVYDFLCQLKLHNYINVNKTTMKITLYNGSEFLFIGCDDPERIKSIAGITDIICEEATELTLEDVSQLDLRLRPKEANPQMLFMFNPTSKASWVYKRWFAETAVIDEDTFILKTTYKDNKFLSPEYINTLEAQIRTNPTYYKIYALGEFTSLNKLVYNNWKVEEFDHTAINGTLICGLDFGYTNDPTAFVASLVDLKEKKIYIFKEWGGTGFTNDQIAKHLSSLGFPKSFIIADSAEPKSIDELRKAGLMRIKPSAKGKDSIMNGISRIQQFEMIIHPDCENVIFELENYAFKKDKFSGEYINQPEDAYNHYMDALRYSIQLVNANDTIKTFNRALLGL